MSLLIYVTFSCQQCVPEIPHWRKLSWQWLDPSRNISMKWKSKKRNKHVSFCKSKHALSVTYLEWDRQPATPPTRKCSFWVVWLVSNVSCVTPWVYLYISAFSRYYICIWVQRPRWRVYFSNTVLIWRNPKSPYGDFNAKMKSMNH